jgi:hypothetical protein
MARLSWTQRLYWRYFSKPVSDRGLFQYCIENRVSSILEVGIGAGDRIRQVLSLCEAPEGVSQIRYAGVDPFESAADGRAHLPLKAAHRMLAEFGVKAHLIPGEPTNSLSRVAHTVLPSDLLIIDGDWETDTDRGKAIAQWLPRLCHSQSCIFASEVSGGTLKRYAPPASVCEPATIRKAA